RRQGSGRGDRGGAHLHVDSRRSQARQPHRHQRGARNLQDQRLDTCRGPLAHQPEMISLFCCRLIFGTALCWLLMPRSLVTFGFFRIQHFVALGLAVTAALTLQPDDSALLATSVTRGIDIAIAVIAYVGSVIWTLGRRTLGLVSIVTIL